MKGISSAATELEIAKYQQLSWPSLSVAYKRNEWNFVHVHDIVKDLAREVYTGHVQPDGWVLPYHVLGDEAGNVTVLGTVAP